MDGKHQASNSVYIKLREGSYRETDRHTHPFKCWEREREREMMILRTVNKKENEKMDTLPCLGEDTIRRLNRHVMYQAKKLKTV